MELSQQEQVAERVQHVLNAIKMGHVPSTGPQLDQLLQATCSEDLQQQAYLRTVINNLYPEPDDDSLSRNTSQSSQLSQLRSRPLADATNTTATASAQASGTPKQSAAASKESSSFLLGSGPSATAAQHSAQWSQASSAGADAAAAGQQYAVADGPSGQPMPLAVAATPEQLSMMVTAATAAATKAVTENLLHSRQSRRSSQDTTAHQHSTTEQLQQAQAQAQQAHQQQHVARPGSFQQPEQQLLRFAEASGAPAGSSGLMSRQQSGSTAAAGAGQAVRVGPLQGPILRITAAATAGADQATPAGLVVVDGIGAAGGAVCFPRLWPEQAVQQPLSSQEQQQDLQQQQQQQHAPLLPERSHASAGAAVVAEADMTSSSTHQQKPPGSTFEGTQRADSSVSAAEVADVEAPAAAPAGTDSAGSVPIITTSKAATHDAVQVVPALASEHKSGAQPAAASASSSAQQQFAGHAPAVSAPAVGSDSNAAPAAAERPAQQAVALPVELDSAVQRALKSLTDPTPPRPLLAPEQTPAAAQQQQRRQLDADRAAVQLLGSRFDYTAALQRLQEAAAAVQDLTAATGARRAPYCSAHADVNPAAASSTAASAAGEDGAAWLCVMPPLTRFYQQEDCWQDLNHFVDAVDAEVAWRLATAAAGPGKAKPAAAAGAGRAAGVSFAVADGAQSPKQQQGTGVAAAAAAGGSATPKKAVPGTPSKGAAARSPGKPSAAAAAAAEQQRTPVKDKAGAADRGGATPQKASPAAAAKPKPVVVAFGRRVDAPLSAPTATGAIRPRSATRRLPAAAMATQGPQQQLPRFVEPALPSAKRRKQSPPSASKAASAAAAAARGGSALQRLQARRLATRAAAAAAMGGVQGGSSAAVLGSALSGLAGAGSIAASEVLDMLVDALMDMPQQQQQQQQLGPEQMVQQAGQEARAGAAAGTGAEAVARVGAAAAAGAVDEPAQILNNWFAQRKTAQQPRQFAAVYDMTGPFDTHAATRAAVAIGVPGAEEDALLQWWRQVQQQQQQQQQQPQQQVWPAAAYSPGGVGAPWPSGHETWGTAQGASAAGIAASPAAAGSAAGSGLPHNSQQPQQQQAVVDVEAELLELLVDEILGQRLLQRSKAAPAAALSAAADSKGAVALAKPSKGAAGSVQQQQQYASAADAELAVAVEEDMAMLQSLREALLVWKPPAIASAAGSKSPAVWSESLHSEQQQQQQQGGVVSSTLKRRQRRELGLLPGMGRSAPQQQQQQRAWQVVPEAEPPQQQQQQQQQEKQQEEAWQQPQPQQQWQQFWEQQEQQVQQLWDATGQPQGQDAMPAQQQRARSRQRRRSLGHLPGLVGGPHDAQAAEGQQVQQLSAQETPARSDMLTADAADLAALAIPALQEQQQEGAVQASAVPGRQAGAAAERSAAELAPELSGGNISNAAPARMGQLFAAPQQAAQDTAGAGVPPSAADLPAAAQVLRSRNVLAQTDDASLQPPGASAAAAAVPAVQLSLPSSACFRDSTESWGAVSQSTVTTTPNMASSRHRYSQDSSRREGLAVAPWWQRQQQQQQRGPLSGGSSDAGYEDDFEQVDAEPSQSTAAAEGEEGEEVAGQAGTTLQHGSGAADAQSPQQQQQGLGASVAPGGGWLSDMLQEFARSPAATEGSPGVAAADGVGESWDAGSSLGGSGSGAGVQTAPSGQQQQQQQQQQVLKELRSVLASTSSAVSLQQLQEAEGRQAVTGVSEGAMPPLLSAGKSPIQLWRPSRTSPAAVAAAAAAVAPGSGSLQPSSTSRSVGASSSSHRSPSATLLRFPPSTPSSGATATTAAVVAAAAVGRRSGSTMRSSTDRASAQRSSAFHTPVDVTSGSSGVPSAGVKDGSSSSSGGGAGSTSRRLLLPSEAAALLAMAADAAGQQLPSPGASDFLQSMGFDPETSLAQLSNISELSELSSSSSDDSAAATAAAAAASTLATPHMLGFLPASLAAAAAGMLQQDSSYFTARSDSTRGSSETGDGSISSGSSDAWGDQWQAWLASQGLGQAVGVQQFVRQGMGGVGVDDRGDGGAGGLAAMAAVLRSSMSGLPPEQLWQLMQQQMGVASGHAANAADVAAAATAGGSADAQQQQQRNRDRTGPAHGQQSEDMDGHISSGSSSSDASGGSPGCMAELSGSSVSSG